VNRTAFTLLGVLACALAGYAGAAAELSGEVVRVADGDTLTIRSASGRRLKIRLYGIDAPEADQPHGPEAERALAGAVAGRRVRVEAREWDDYGRIVGVVYAGERNVNLAMVCEGEAWWYRHYAGGERAMRDCEEQARAARRGLWQAPDPVAPWDWRRRRR